MTAEGSVQNIGDDHYIVSNSRSKTTLNHQQRSHSPKPSTVKILGRRRRHDESHNTKQHHRSNHKQRPITTIHVTVRPATIHSSENKSDHNLNDFYSFSSTLHMHHHHHNTASNKSCTVVHVDKKSKYPNNITIADPHESPLPSKSSNNSWDNEDSRENFTKEYKAKDGRLDWTSFENEHHANKKKKKKCTRPCVIISIIAVLLLVIIATVILAVLLTKSKTNTTINKIAVLRWNTTGITVAGVTGRSGNASNLLNTPFGLAIDYAHTLYITDTYNNRIQKYLRDASSGTAVAGQTDGTANATSAYLYSPCDVAVVDSTGDTYVADTFNHRIQFWASGSSSGVTIIGNGSLGSSTNQLSRPYGLFRDSDSGTLYISDSANYRVLRLISGQASGTVVAGGHGGGLNNTQLYLAYGLHFDSVSNSLIIPNVGAHNIVQWVIGASSWTRIAGNATGSPGSTSTELQSPADLTLDPMGNIYVADASNHRIQFFSSGQSIGQTIAGTTSVFGNSSNRLTQPLSVALDSQLNLYVSDAGNSRIQKFLRY